MKRLFAVLAVAASPLLTQPGQARDLASATAAPALTLAMQNADAAPAVSAATSPVPDGAVSATPSSSPAGAAAPVEASPASTATPAALSAPAVPTTPVAAPTVGPTVQSSLTPAQADPAPPPAPAVVARINLAKQRMEVLVDGVPRYSWPVSTARKGYRTPVGTYRPERMHRRYFSRKYDNAPMPYAIFFHRGWAIHGTNDLRRLGSPASHGCVRLHPANAKTLFALVSEHGRANTRIVVISR